MVQYTYTKQVNSDRLLQEIKDAGLSSIHHIDTVGTSVAVCFSEALSPVQKTNLDTIIASHILTTTRDTINALIDSAYAFSAKLMKDFVVENVMLGITQRGLTKHVRLTTREIKDALESGSLRDAIMEIRALDPADFDPVILTPARLLLFRNKIETWLGVPLADSWDAPETWL
jgi:hypothetical protein